MGCHGCALDYRYRQFDPVGGGRVGAQVYDSTNGAGSGYKGRGIRVGACAIEDILEVGEDRSIEDFYGCTAGCDRGCGNGL
jgi:hypothetical protein